MLVDPTCTRIGSGAWRGWRTNGEIATSSPAGRLLVAGEFEGEYNVETVMTVTADGALVAPVVVTVSVSGGTSTFDPSSDTLTSGGSVAFGVTPTSTGALTYTFSAPGLVSATLVFTAEDPAPALPDLSTLWMIDGDPSLAFEASQGEVPAGVVAHAASSGLGYPYSPALLEKTGENNQLRASLTISSNPSAVIQKNLWVSGQSDVTATHVYGIPSGTGLDPNYSMFSRVADPLDGAKWAFRHEGDKTKIGFTAQQGKWRSFYQGVGDEQRADPWGTEYWVATGFILDTDWIHAERGPYHELIDFHDGNGGLTEGSAFQVALLPGNGNPANVQMEITIKRYNRADWPQNQATKDKKNYEFVTSIPGGIPTNTQFWLVTHFKTGNGFPDYPGYNPAAGGNPGNPVWGVYGSTDPRDPFAEVYYAVGNNDPELIYRWDDAYAKSISSTLNGFWGSPYPTTQSQASKLLAGYVQVGLYTSCKFKPTSAIGNVIGYHSKGFMQFRAKDICKVPGGYDPSRASAKSVLAAFRAAR